MKDKDILELYWIRDEKAIAETEKQYGKYCYSISYNILHNNEDAEECVNDTWVGAWDSIPPAYPARFACFLGKITRNLSLNRLKLHSAAKRGKGEVALVLSELENCIPAKTGTEQSFDEQYTVDVINGFLRAQSEKNRNIFIRRYFYMFSVRDIAECYGISENNVASILFRMRGALKAQLEKEGVDL